MKLEEMSKAGKLVCLGYLTLLYSYDQALLVKCKKLARKVYPLLLKCIENDEKQYLGLNKHQLYIFGMLSCKGLGCHKNLEDAFNCFRLSSMDNYPPSLCQLASFYEHGVYVTQDLYLAFKLYQLAATLGEPVSQYKLAFSYTSGLVVPSDYWLSFYYFYLSAKQGYKPAIHNLFLLFVIISVLVCWILGIILFILFAI